jgi:signal transduction histidine kinase
MLLGDAAFAATRQARVLVLHSTRQDSELALLADRDLPRLLTSRLPRTIDYYAEYMDTARIANPKHDAALRDFLYRKYRYQHLDLVIAMQDAAWQFVRRYGDAVFPGTPVVFSSSGPKVARRRNSTGVISKVNLRGTLDLALALQPEVTRVFVISGASNRDKVYEHLARAQLRSFEPRVTLTYLTGLPRAELERRVATLPERSIIYYLLFYQDGTGENLNPLDFLDRLTAVANRPTYSWVDSTINHGVVGGRMEEQSALVQAVANSSIRVLQGKRPSTIPISTIDVYAAQLDWRQLQRWHISDLRVPPGTRVSYRQPGSSNGDRRFPFTVVLPLSVVFLIAVGVTMVAQRRHRRHAQNDWLGSEAFRIDERMRDLAWRMLKATEDERSRIARELHDDISQQAAVLMIDLERAIHFVGKRSSEAMKLVRAALTHAKSLSKSVHDLSYELHPGHLRVVGLVGALAQLQRDLSRPGVVITVSAENVAPTLPDDVALCLFRVVQEGMHNAIKHSGARNIRVQVSGGNDVLLLTITDDGRGFDVRAASGKGLGLIGMRERVGAVGGTLQIVSQRGAGTRLDVGVPLPAPQASIMRAS